jgi:STE24 endopeptidase
MHPLMSLTWTILDLSALFALFSLVINNHTLLAQFGFEYESNFVSFLIFMQCYEAFNWFSSFFQTVMTRKMEFAADAFAAQDPLYKIALCRALIKIHITNSSNLNPDPFYATLKFSHPQLTERLKAMGYKGFEEEDNHPDKTKDLGGIGSINDD